MGNETKIDDGGPAFPRPFSGEPNGGWYYKEQDGMGLRDYFAAKAMQAFVSASYLKMLANPDAHEKYDAAISESAYKIADAMLKAGGK